MHKKKHCAVGIGLLICFSIGVLSFFYLDFEQLYCRFSAIEHQKHTIELTQIRVSAREADGRHELWHSGVLYDVKSCTITGDSATLIVWHDAGEETVQKEMVAVTENNTGASFDVYSYHGPQFAKVRSGFPDVKVITHMYTNPSATFAVNHKKSGFLYRPAELCSSLQYDVIKPPPDQELI